MAADARSGAASLAKSSTSAEAAARVDGGGRSPSRRRLVLVCLATAGADLGSKFAASRWLDDGPVRLGGGLTLRLVHNPGVAFGLGAQLPPGALLVITALAASGLGWAAWRHAVGPVLAAGLVVGGAVANLLDRATAGTVVDMFDVGWWPTFNVADICISVGAFWMVLAGMRSPASVPGPEPDPRLGGPDSVQRINTR